MKSIAFLWFTLVATLAAGCSANTKDPNGRKLYTANGVSNDVSVIDAASLKVIATIHAGEGPWGVAAASSK